MAQVLFPITLRGDLIEKMSGNEFFDFCQKNPEKKIERNHRNEIILHAPTGTIFSHFKGELLRQLANWAQEKGRGPVFDSSTGFQLPDGSVFSPAASWMKEEKWDAIEDKAKEKFAPACPDFVIEVRAGSDKIGLLREKMDRWLENGVALAWLIDPILEESVIYRKRKQPHTIIGFDCTLSSEDVLPGFSMHLSGLKK